MTPFCRLTKLGTRHVAQRGKPRKSAHFPAGPLNCSAVGRRPAPRSSNPKSRTHHRRPRAAAIGGDRHMGIVSGAWLAVLGMLGASNLIIAKKPDAKELIAKFAPYQGWIGAVSALWGVWGIISSVLNLGWLSVAPIYWATFLADSVLGCAPGLLLGVGVLET